MTTDDSWPPIGLEDEEPTDVTTPEEVTREHDGGEWLAGFNRGVTAGRQDVIEALRKTLGDSPLWNYIETSVLTALRDTSKR